MKKQKNAQISEKTPRTCKISRSPSWTGARQQTIPRHLCFSPRNGRNPAVHIVSGSKVKRKLGANSEKGRKESWGLPKRKSDSGQRCGRSEHRVPLRISTGRCWHTSESMGTCPRGVRMSPTSSRSYPTTWWHFPGSSSAHHDRPEVRPSKISTPGPLPLLSYKLRLYPDTLGVRDRFLVILVCTALYRI